MEFEEFVVFIVKKFTVNTTKVRIKKAASELTP